MAVLQERYMEGSSFKAGNIIVDFPSGDTSVPFHISRIETLDQVLLALEWKKAAGNRKAEERLFNAIAKRGLARLGKMEGARLPDLLQPTEFSADGTPERVYLHFVAAQDYKDYAVTLVKKSSGIYNVYAKAGVVPQTGKVYSLEELTQGDGVYGGFLTFTLDAKSQQVQNFDLVLNPDWLKKAIEGTIQVIVNSAAHTFDYRNHALSTDLKSPNPFGKPVRLSSEEGQELLKALLTQQPVGRIYRRHDVSSSTTIVVALRDGKLVEIKDNKEQPISVKAFDIFTVDELGAGTVSQLDLAAVEDIQSRKESVPDPHKYLGVTANHLLQARANIQKATAQLREVSLSIESIQQGLLPITLNDPSDKEDISAKIEKNDIRDIERIRVELLLDLQDRIEALIELLSKEKVSDLLRVATFTGDLNRQFAHIVVTLRDFNRNYIVETSGVTAFNKQTAQIEAAFSKFQNVLQSVELYYGARFAATAVATPSRQFGAVETLPVVRVPELALVGADRAVRDTILNTVPAEDLDFVGRAALGQKSEVASAGLEGKTLVLQIRPSETRSYQVFITHDAKNKEVVVVKFAGVEPVLIYPEQIVRGDFASPESADVTITAQDVIRLARAQEQSVQMSLDRIAGLNHTQPVLIEYDIAILGDPKDAEYSARLGARLAEAFSSRKAEFSKTRNLFIRFIGADAGLIDRAYARAEEIRLELSALGSVWSQRTRDTFVRDTVPGAQIVRVLEANTAVTPEAGVRYLFAQKYQAGDFGSFATPDNIAQAAGLIDPRQPDPNFVQALATAAGTKLDTGIVASILAGVASLKNRLLAAMKPLSRIKWAAELYSAWRSAVQTARAA